MGREEDLEEDKSDYSLVKSSLAPHLSMSLQLLLCVFSGRHAQLGCSLVDLAFQESSSSCMEKRLTNHNTHVHADTHIHSSASGEGRV